MTEQKFEEIGDSPKLHEKEDICICPPKYVSYFYRSPQSTIPRDIVTFYHSFGYNCNKLFNLCLIDPDVLVFGSGNLIHFFRVSTKEMTFRRSAGGGGIGYVTVNPNPKYNYLTVAENGTNPLVLIYKFPELEVISVLEDGAEKSFTCAAYNPNGELLATQAGDPCYMITIWKWKTQSILLRTKSFQNDVLNVMFSPYNPKQLITSGLGHIKFWKMSNTFTGLKLLGDLGRFGKTEICDIYATYPMPDEKVISGCEWGNLLIWDDGLIKMEVCRKNRKPCHTAPITMITMEENGELMTVGMDGYIRFWFWETVETANILDDDYFIEIEPIYEFKVGSANKICDIRSFLRIDPQDKKKYKYYVQDSNGKIWYSEINIENVRCESTEIFTCHKGRIVSAATSPISSHVATLDEFGCFNLYNYNSKKLLFTKNFISNGTDMLWLSENIDSSGSIMVLGFEDGVIRQILIDVNQLEINQSVILIDVIRAHSEAITKFSINPKENILISGCQDCTVFIFTFQQTNTFVKLIPIGYLKVQSAPTAFNWNDKDTATLLIGCSRGEMYEGKVPSEPCSYTNVSYHLHAVELKTYKFKSCKSEIRRQLKIDEIEKLKEKKRLRKIEKLNKLKFDNPGIDIDEEIFLQDSESDEELEPLYYPETPNPILWLRYTPENSIWLSIAGYDAGYIYERDFSDNGIVKNTIIYQGDDIEIQTYLVIQNYLIFGMQDGCIRINKIKDNFHDLSDFWKLSMHDNLNGKISKLCLSYDENYIFSVGYDGNIFVYKWNGPKTKFDSNIINKKIIKDLQKFQIQSIHDIDDLNCPSLEEQKRLDEQKYRSHLANQRKEKIHDVIANYKLIYKDIMKRNRDLPTPQRYTVEKLELDPRITADLMQSIQEKIDLVRTKLAYDIEKAELSKRKVMEYFIKPLELYPFEVKAIRSNKSVKIFRIKRLTNEFYKAKTYAEERIAQEKHKKTDDLYGYNVTSENIKYSFKKDDKFTFDIDSDMNDIELSGRMARILKRCNERKLQEYEFQRKFEEHRENKPDINVNDKNDVIDIRNAKKTIGDYKLKTDSNYKNEDCTVSQKLKQILDVREELFKLRNDYNKRIKDLRLRKKKIYKFVNKQKLRLEIIHKQIPENKRKFIEDLPEIQMDIEYPENNLKPTVDSTERTTMSDILFIKPERQSSIVYDISNFSKRNKKIKELEEKLHQEILNLEPEKNIELPECTELYKKIDEHSKLSENGVHLFEDEINKFDETACELEICYDYIMKHIIEQDEIIEEIQYQINDFDDCLEKIYNDRFQIELKAKFLEQFLITLNQEFWILKDYENIENDLLEKIENIILKHNNVKLQKIKTTAVIENERKNIDKLHEQIKSIQDKFMKILITVTNNNKKYSNFLQKIFKRKYKTEKSVQDEDETTSSSSDSSEDDKKDEDFDDNDSHIISPIKLDESICPSDLELRFYDETFRLRNERYKLEQKIHIKQKQLDEKKDEVNELKSQRQQIEKELNDSYKTLNDIMREKQDKLNKIQTLVVLRLDQIAHVRTTDNLESIYDLDKTLLFKNETITKLQNRVGELNAETLNVKNEYKSNIVNLGRLKSEIRLMAQQISDLKDKIKTETIKKFGRNIDINELEKLTLQKYIFDKKSALENEKKEFEKKMARKREELVKYEQELIRERQRTTEKLNILAVLQEEKNYLTEMIFRQEQYTEKSKTIKKIDFSHDLKKLKDIDKQQLGQIEFLEKEIRLLRDKSSQFHIDCDKQEEDNVAGNFLPSRSRKCEKYGVDYDDQQFYLTIQEKVQASSKLSSAVNTSVIAENIKKITQKFLQNCFKEIISIQEKANLLKKISDYLNNLLNLENYDEQTVNDELLQTVMKYFEDIIPQKYLKHIKISDVVILLNEILNVRDEQKDKFKFDEIIKSIIQNSLDIVKQTASNNFTQDLINEIFCEIIEILTIEDISNENSKIVELICENLIRDSDNVIDHKNIDIDILIDAVKKHAETNQIEDIDIGFLINLGSTLIHKFSEFKENT